jgi:hypothetical protein
VRGEPNAFNVLRVERAAIVVERHEWQATAGGFAPADTQRFARTAGGWVSE